MFPAGSPRGSHPSPRSPSFPSSQSRASTASTSRPPPRSPRPRPPQAPQAPYAGPPGRASQRQDLQRGPQGDERAGTAAPTRPTTDEAELDLDDLAQINCTVTIYTTGEKSSPRVIGIISEWINTYSFMKSKFAGSSAEGNGVYREFPAYASSLSK